MSTRISEIRLMELAATYQLLRDCQHQTGDETLVQDWLEKLSEFEQKHVRVFDRVRGILATEIMIEGAARILAGAPREWTSELFRADIDPVEAHDHAHAVDRLVAGIRDAN